MKIVIAGAGQAAASMAAKLRQLGHDGPILIIGDEDASPYQRPPLSKAYLLGDMPRERLMLRSDDWWAEQDVTLMTGTRVLSIDRTAREIKVEDATGRHRESYDALALCLGAEPRCLPAVMGGGKAGVHVVRDLADIDALQPELVPGRRMVVIGGGYIGLEAAAVARKLGLEVTVVEAAPRILGRVASEPMAGLIRRLHTAHGVEIIEGAAVDSITGDARVEAVALADGCELPCDIVICGIGVTPRTALAEAAGLEIANGIAVDAEGRTSDPAIWAAGDCASFPHGEGRLRLEAVSNAIDMGEAVAANMLGAGKPYVPKPWFWSDQYDAKLQITGLGNGADQVVVRGHEAGAAEPGGASVWSFRDGQLICVEALNDPRGYMVGKRLIDAGRNADPAAVADPNLDLKALMK